MTKVGLNLRKNTYVTDEGRKKIREELDRRGINQAQVARDLGLSRQTVGDVLWGYNTYPKTVRMVVDAVGFDFREYHSRRRPRGKF